MKQVHNVRVRIIDRDKQLIDELFARFIGAAGIDPKLAQVTYSDDGERDPLNIGELWLDRQQPVRKAVGMLTSRLPEEDKEKIRAHPEQFIDMATHCFLRLEKKAFLSDEVKLSQESSTIQVRLNLAAFPATKENAIPVLKSLFA